MLVFPTLLAHIPGRQGPSDRHCQRQGQCSWWWSTRSWHRGRCCWCPPAPASPGRRRQRWRRRSRRWSPPQSWSPFSSEKCWAKSWSSVHLQLSAKAVNEVVPAAVHAVEDEEDVEDDDEEAEHDLHTRGQLEELDTTKVSDCHLNKKMRKKWNFITEQKNCGEKLHWINAFSSVICNLTFEPFPTFFSKLLTCFSILFTFAIFSFFTGSRGLDTKNSIPFT